MLWHLRANYKDVDAQVTAVEREIQQEKEATKAKKPPPTKFSRWRSQSGRILIGATSLLTLAVVAFFVFQNLVPKKLEIELPMITSDVEPTGKQAQKKKIPEGMVKIPAGTFMMGSNDGGSDEKPVHKVSVAAFYMDKYEVTVEKYEKFLKAKGHRKPTNWSDQLTQPKHPVVNVSWQDATTYAKWAGKRLPTEAEWEYATRGGNTGVGGKPIYKYPWGNNATREKANYSGTEGKDQWDGTSPVGSFEANGYGLYDMAGNAWEWCSDWYDENYYASSPERNPKGAPSSSSRVLRGGSWFNDADIIRCANRLRLAPTYRDFLIGFRCVQDVL